MSEEETEAKVVGWRIARISGLMAALFLFFQLLPDFAPERPDDLLRKINGDVSPELCDESNLGFAQVNSRRSPFIMQLQAEREPVAGQETSVTVSLSTPGGRPIAIDQLREVHTEKFHLLVVDPSLEDYHHVHPATTAVPGEYTFTFAPGRPGLYRFFADLLPEATGRPAQAAADLEVTGEAGRSAAISSGEAMVGEHRFELAAPAGGFVAGKPAAVSLRVRHADGEQEVELQPVMGAFAHLVAFDSGRSGFAHMHPVQEGLDVRLDKREPELTFVFFASQPGDYTVWAQVKMDDEERFAPFRVSVR